MGLWIATTWLIFSILTGGREMPQNCPFPRRILAHIVTSARRRSCRKRQFDRFSRFCRVHVDSSAANHIIFGIYALASVEDYNYKSQVNKIEEIKQRPVKSREAYEWQDAVFVFEGFSWLKTLCAHTRTSAPLSHIVCERWRRRPRWTTDIHRARNIANNKSHLMLCIAMRCGRV